MNNKGNNDSLHLFSFKPPTSWAEMSESNCCHCAFSMRNGVITKITAFAKNIANGGLLPDTAYKELFIPFVNNSNNFFYIDGWTMTHLFCGIFFGYLYLYLKWDPGKFVIISLLICILWEIFEYICGVTILKIRGADSLTDAIVDTLFFMLGATVAYKNIRTIKFSSVHK